MIPCGDTLVVEHCSSVIIKNGLKQLKHEFVITFSAPPPSKFRNWVGKKILHDIFMKTLFGYEVNYVTCNCGKKLATIIKMESALLM
jgi:hypothetical protein